MNPAVPPSVVDAAGPVEGWSPLESSDHVWAAPETVVKRGAPGRATAEAERLGWLAGRVPVPAVVHVADGGADGWLVTERLAGHPSHRVDLHGDIGGITTTVATALRALHDTPVDPATFPFATGWQALADELGAGIDGVDPATLPDPYRRYDAARLLEIWLGGRPDVEDLVLCHGRPELANLIVDPAPVGWVDVGRLRLADRHADLAIIQHSLHQRFGPDSVFAFYEAYGFDADLVRLDHYLLASFLQP